MSSCPHRWETLLTELSACLPAQSQANSCLHLITQVPLPSSQDYKALSKILLSQLLSLPVSMWRDAERGDAVGTAVTRLPGYLVHVSLHRGLWNDNILKTDLSDEKSSVVNRVITISYSKCVWGKSCAKKRDVRVNVETGADGWNCISVLQQPQWR